MPKLNSREMLDMKAFVGIEAVSRRDGTGAFATHSVRNANFSDAVSFHVNSTISPARNGFSRSIAGARAGTKFARVSHLYKFMNHNLERYLNDHLAGSAGALLMIDHLIQTTEVEESRQFFKDLHHHVEEDQKLLELLIELAAMHVSGTLKATGHVAARVGMLKLKWEGFEPGELGLFEALEMLSIGIHGKRQLWVMIQQISPWFPEWHHIDFIRLEWEASMQHDAVEEWRIKAGIDALPDLERRTATSH
jgi:hypothetical protein